MNKSELIDALSKKEGLTEKQAADVVNLIFKGFDSQLKSGRRIEIRGFGSFVVRDYDSYTGRNPKTGAEVYVPAKNAVFFKTGKELKKMVNSRPDSYGI